MRKYFLFFTTAILPLALIACAERKTESVFYATKPTPGPISTIVPYFNETPKEFYKHFKFQMVEFCPEPWYRYAGTKPFLIGRDERNRILDGQIFILLSPTGRYEALYSENSYRSDLVGQFLDTKIEGRWKIEGLTLVLEDLGRGTPLNLNGKRMIEFTFERDLIRHGLKGKTVQIGALTSNDYAVGTLSRCAGN